jgi:hypothetical protein
LSDAEPTTRTSEGQAMTEINVTDLIAEMVPLLPEFAVLYNPTVDEINALAKLKPELFIYSFITKGNINNLPDMTGIVESTHVIQPVWLVDCDKRDHITIVRQLIEPMFSQGRVSSCAFHF